jgi:hypothetical protein
MVYLQLVFNIFAFFVAQRLLEIQFVADINYEMPLRSSSSRWSSRETAGSDSQTFCNSLIDVTQSQPPMLNNKFGNASLMAAVTDSIIDSVADPSVTVNSDSDAR